MAVKLSDGFNLASVIFRLDPGHPADIRDMKESPVGYKSKSMEITSCSPPSPPKAPD